MKDKDAIEYEPDSFVDGFDPTKAKKFETSLKRGGQGHIKFDRKYLDHISKFHGGIPKNKCFRTAEGTEKVVVRFLNFTRTDHPMGQYGVAATWSLIEDRLGPNLMPFAELFAGDVLCFDHEHPGRPRVVVWFHEESMEDEPYTEFVADNFDEFLTTLYEC